MLGLDSRILHMKINTNQIIGIAEEVGDLAQYVEIRFKNGLDLATAGIRQSQLL